VWLVPSRGRPHLAQRLFDCGFKEKGILILDEGDAQRYDRVRLPFGWKKLVLQRLWLSPKLNVAFDLNPEEPWYGILNDDHLPVTSGWEAEMVREGQKGMAWPDDNYGKRISSHVKSGDLCRLLGWFVCPAIKHYYLDDVDELLAGMVGGRFLSHIMVSHEHANAGRAPMDRTYLERPNPNLDKKAFLQWRENEWPAIAERLKMRKAA
jgi:hypothetical protein